MIEQILIKQISLKNFRGIAAGKHEFSENDFIHGAFGSGKSSFYNAYKWVMGLNVDFAPNINGAKIKGAETAVDVVFTKGVVEYAFRREAKQVWKLEADGTQRFDKYKYAYYYNGVEQKPKEYAERVLQFYELSNEIELNMAIDCQYFNSTAEPKWNAEKRRAYLFEKFGIAAKTEELCKEYPLIYGDIYGAKLTQEQLRKGIKSKRDGIKLEVARNAAVIENAQAALAELNGIDFAEISVELKSKWDELNRLNEETTAESKLNRVNELAEQIAALRMRKAKAQEEAENAIAEHKKSVAALTVKVEQISRDIRYVDEDIKTRKSGIENIEIDKTQLEDTKFDGENAICPVCRRKLAPTTVAKKKQYFEEEKAEKLKSMAETKTMFESRIGELESRKAHLEELLKQTEEKRDNLIDHAPKQADTAEIDKAIADLSAELANAKPTAAADTAERKAALQKEINSLNLELAKRDRIAELNREIETRRADNVKLMNAEAELIRQKAQLDEFSLKEIELAEGIINSHFGGVKFNFLAELGGASEQGVRKTCVATYQGIEYDKLSGGQQIICDYLVSKSLREINGWKYPQWTDEVCRVSNTIDRLQEVFDFDLNEWQNIVLLTDDYAKLSVEYLKGA
jgi:DNA repair exonuclease SbcCD ATPase subunit